MKRRIEILGNPIPQARPRTYTKAGKSITYDPLAQEKETTSWIIKAQCQGHIPTPEATYTAHFRFYMPIALSLSQKQKNIKSWLPHDSRPDFDNLAKFYSDCANGILWADDSQLVVVTVSKQYSNNPRTVIEFTMHEEFSLSANDKAILEAMSRSQFDDFCDDIRKILDHERYTESRYEEDEVKELTADLFNFAQAYHKVLTKIAQVKK